MCFSNKGRSNQKCLWSLWRQLLQLHAHRRRSPFSARTFEFCALPTFEVRGAGLGRGSDPRLGGSHPRIGTRLCHPLHPSQAMCAGQRARGINLRHLCTQVSSKRAGSVRALCHTLPTTPDTSHPSVPTVLGPGRGGRCSRVQAGASRTATGPRKETMRGGERENFSGSACACSGRLQ